MTDGTEETSIVFRLSDFANGSIVGKGHFSIVCRAVSKRDGSEVALKKVKLSGMFDSKARSDCMKEVQLLKELQHPNVIQYLGSFIENGEMVIILELAAGGDLSLLLAHCQKICKLMTEKKIWLFFTQICAGLEHIHSKRIVHRDIKPANVFLTSDGSVKLGDLGLARYFNRKTVAVHSLVGTPYYMSPERLMQTGYDFSSDIWSLGCLLYEMAALQPPFMGTKMNFTALRLKIEKGQYPPLPCDVYSEHLRQMVQSCLIHNLLERPDINEVHERSVLIKKMFDSAEQKPSLCNLLQHEAPFESELYSEETVFGNETVDLK